MTQAILSVLIGFALLIWSADKFIAGAASIASNSGMSKLMIGLTIVAFGTSAPEMLVSLLAALDGSNDIAVGNALGSNITNIGLVLGATGLIAAIPINVRLLKIDVPLLLAIMLVAGVILSDYKVTLIESLVLVSLLVLYLFYLYKQKDSSVEEDEEDEVDEYTGLSTKKAWFYFFMGLIILVGSAELLVEGAVFIAKFYQIPELVIGVTIIALGTSLPELAASITSALRGHYDIAFGNVVGSNIFNLLVVMAMPGFVNPSSLDHAVFYRDYFSMVLITLGWFAMLLILYWLKRPFGKLCGFLLLGSYAVYYSVLFSQIQ